MRFNHDESPSYPIFLWNATLDHPPHAFPLAQPITDDIFNLTLIQPKNPFQQDAAAHQPSPGFSSLLPSPLQHQANCLQSLHKTIQQFNQHLKAERLDRKTLQHIVLQLQNDFALLLFMLFSSVGTIPISDNFVEILATGPTIHPKPYPNPNPTSNELPLPCAAEPSDCRSTPVGAVGPPGAKTNNSANANFQSIPNTQEAPSIKAQNLTSRIAKLEKILADEIPTYISVTAGIHSQNIFFYDKIRQLEAGNSDAIIWKIPSVKFVFDSAKLARTSSNPLIESASSFSSPIFRTYPHVYSFSIKFYPCGIGLATGRCASNLFTLFPGDYDNLL